MQSVPIDDTCTLCKGAKRVTVDRELSHDLETCHRCNGSGKEPEKYLRQQRVLSVITDFNSDNGNQGDAREVDYVWEGPRDEILWISVNTKNILNFFSLVSKVLNGYHPRFQAVTVFSHGEQRIELVFSPND